VQHDRDQQGGKEDQPADHVQQRAFLPTLPPTG
jgi:hypothetical protein